MNLELVAIIPGGIPAREIEVIPKVVEGVMMFTSGMYQEHGYYPPWGGYLALDGQECVGTCAFKSEPRNGRVEIAYFTFPGNEGKGVASAMAKQLIAMSREADEAVQIFAQTLPEKSASARVLAKLGFTQTRELKHPEDGVILEWELLE